MPQANNTPFSAQTLSVGETAKYMGIGRKLVYQLIEFGEIAAIRQGGAVRVDRASVDAFIQSGKRI
jgi:excisionase family DNA binding protein